MSTERQPQEGGWANRAGIHIPGSRPTASSTPPEKQAYKACSTVDHGSRSLCLLLKNGEFHAVAAWPVRLKSTRPDMLIIKTPTDAITLHGRGMREVARLVADAKATALHEFDPATDKDPAADQPRIDLIEIVEVREMP